MCSLNIWILMPLLNKASGIDGNHPFQTDRTTLRLQLHFVIILISMDSRMSKAQYHWLLNPDEINTFFGQDKAWLVSILITLIPTKISPDPTLETTANLDEQILVCSVQNSVPTSSNYHHVFGNPEQTNKVAN
jgi:hypothetical protein